MNNKQVLTSFLEKENAKTNLRNITNGIYQYKGRTLYTQKTNNNDIELINYSTRIAYIKDNNLYINIKKYSSTTSKIQTQLKDLASKFNYNIIEYQEN